MLNLGFGNGLGNGLSTIPIVSSAKTRSVTAENPAGEKGAGGKAASNLGAGRKGRPLIKLPHGKATVLADIEGPGVIQHIWMTCTDRTDAGCYVLRDLVLRIFWDDEKTPSVEVPLGDFFCNGFGVYCRINSMPIVVNPAHGKNCYFPMPFLKRARVEILNQHAADIDSFYYTINYSIADTIPDNAAYFHAQWRRENPTVKKKDYTILDNVRGQGHYVGTYLTLAQLERYWWGEGEIKIYIDGDREWPTICGTGAEDYFGGAWSFYEHDGGRVAYATYNTPFLGYPFYSKEDTTKPHIFGADTVPMHGMYRWHLMDPIRFEKDLRITIQQIGTNGRQYVERSDDISSVAYWYQYEPHAEFPMLLPPEERWPR